MVYKDKQAAKQLCECLHPVLIRSGLDNMIIGQATGGVKMSKMFD